MSLFIDKAEWIEDLQKGQFSLKGSLSVVGESIDEQESWIFEEELESKEKHNYLHGACDAGSR